MRLQFITFFQASMLLKIKHFFEANFTDKNTDKITLDERLKRTTAALFIETMLQDGDLKASEKEKISDILKNQFCLTEKQSDDLFELATIERETATDYHQFTKLIAKEFSQPQKITLIENLWHIAYADNHLDKYEENMIRRIADLIYVSHKEFIQAKHRASGL